MKRIIVIVIIGFVFATVQAQMDNPLKEGMPNMRIRDVPKFISLK